MRTWTGEATEQGGGHLTLIFQLTQVDDQVSGSFTSSPAGVTGDMAATANGNDIEGTVQFSDGCVGTITATLEQGPSPNELPGGYSVPDSEGCTHETRATFLLIED